MKLTRSFGLLILFFIFGISAQAQVPAKPNPVRFVNDYAQIFSSTQRNTLENRLRIFSDSTSNQIVIVTLNDLQGMDKADLAYQIGQTWGVGHSDFNNGVVMLIKPKNQTKGEVFIATGYGLEGALPDALTRRIIEQQMIPQFQQNDYYQGVVNALNIILPAAIGEYNQAREENVPIWPAFIALFIIIMIAVLLSRNKGGDDYHGGKGGGNSGGRDFLTGVLLGGLAGRSHSGSWGGGGGFSGGGSFGGGGFGGGGAGGSW